MIQIENLSFSYNKSRPLFSGIDMQIPEGRIIGLLGKNGAGKTTLLRLIVGLLTPGKGKVTANDLLVSKRPTDVLKELFFIPEEYYLPDVSIEEFIKANSVFYPKFDMKLQQEIANEFELETRRNLKELSFGQRKKFLVSFALATNVKLLILDEPTNGLDIPSKAQFRKVISKYFNEERSIIVSTHQVKDVENLIDDVIILENGTVLFHHSTEEISGKLMKSKVKPADQKALFTEELPDGEVYLLPNDGKADANIDLEMLFNAAISNPTNLHLVFTEN